MVAKLSTIKPVTSTQLKKIKERLLIQQNYICPICNTSMKHDLSRNQVIDHDHATGQIRAVVHRGCNWSEGLLKSACIKTRSKITAKELFTRILNYWEYHKKNPSGYFYPEKKKRRRKRA